MKNRLKKERLLHKMSQEELAEKSGISRTTLSKIENEDFFVTNNITMEKIAKALETKVTNIFFSRIVQHIIHLKNV